MSGVDVKFERTSVVEVSRGLLVVRYATSASTNEFPVAIVRPAATFERAIEIVSAPGSAPGSLEKPGDCLVVRVHEAARLQIGLRRIAPTGSLDASFQVEILGAGKAPEAVMDAARTVAAPVKSATISNFGEPAAPQAASAQPDLSFVAHVSMRGDVAVGHDEWMAGPTAPAPIEGLEVRSGEPGKLAIETQVLVAGAAKWSDWIGAGVYAGTRGRGLALIGVRFRLAGADVANKEIFADALFLGDMAVAKAGRQIDFASATGSDPLVGLKLGVRTMEKSPTTQLSDGPWRDRGSRVRVFRSSSGG